MTPWDALDIQSISVIGVLLAGAVCLQREWLVLPNVVKMLRSTIDTQAEQIDLLQRDNAELRTQLRVQLERNEEMLRFARDITLRFVTPAGG